MKTEMFATPSAPLTSSLGAGDAPHPKTAAEAARQFEALLLAQMLRTAHASSNSLDGEEDATSESMWDVATQHFAQLLADSGGVGLASMITRGLQAPQKEQEPDARPAAATRAPVD